MCAHWPLSISAIIAAFGSYSAEALGSPATQIRDTSKVWLFAFLR
jgi:hypothetical protein